MRGIQRAGVHPYMAQTARPMLLTTLYIIYFLLSDAESRNCPTSILITLFFNTCPNILRGCYRKGAI